MSKCMGRDCDERAVFVVDFLPLPPSYGADKAAYNCHNHISLAHFLKARLCFEHATYLNARGQITENMASFCSSIIFVFSYFTALPKPYARSLTRCLQLISVASKLQIEGATYLNSWGRICRMSHASFDKLFRSQICSSTRNV